MPLTCQNRISREPNVILLGHQAHKCQADPAACHPAPPQRSEPSLPRLKTPPVLLPSVGPKQQERMKRSPPVRLQHLRTKRPAREGGLTQPVHAARPRGPSPRGLSGDGPAAGPPEARPHPPPQDSLAEREALHPPGPPAPRTWALWQNNEKRYFPRLLKLRRERRDQICHLYITFLQRLMKSPGL